MPGRFIQPRLPVASLTAGCRASQKDSMRACPMPGFALFSGSVRRARPRPGRQESVPCSSGNHGHRVLKAGKLRVVLLRTEAHLQARRESPCRCTDSFGRPAGKYLASTSSEAGYLPFSASKSAAQRRGFSHISRRAFSCANTAYTCMIASGKSFRSGFPRCGIHVSRRSEPICARDPCPDARFGFGHRSIPRLWRPRSAHSPICVAQP